MSTTDKLDLDALERLLDDATPSPWFWDSYSLIASQAIQPNDPLDQESECDECERPFFEHADFYRKNRPYRICGEFKQAEREAAWARVATMDNLPPGGHGDQLHDRRQQAAAELIEKAINTLPALIQRLREAEARAQMNFETVQKCSTRIAQLEAENQHLTETGAELIRMTLKLERVREAAQQMLVSLDMNSVHPARTKTGIERHERLRAALAAVEEKGR